MVLKFHCACCETDHFYKTMLRGFQNLSYAYWRDTVESAVLPEKNIAPEIRIPRA